MKSIVAIKSPKTAGNVDNNQMINIIAMQLMHIFSFSLQKCSFFVILLAQRRHIDFLFNITSHVLSSSFSFPLFFFFFFLQRQHLIWSRSCCRAQTTLTRDLRPNRSITQRSILWSSTYFMYENDICDIFLL